MLWLGMKVTLLVRSPNPLLVQWLGQRGRVALDDSRVAAEFMVEDWPGLSDEFFSQLGGSVLVELRFEDLDLQTV